MASSSPPLPTPNPSTLRELALRSMKPKRMPTDQPNAKRPPPLQTNVTPRPRRPPSPKDVLDYGEPMDVDPKSPTSPASAASSTRPGLSRLGSIRLRPTGQAPVALAQEHKDREEGEISEEEIRGKKLEEKPKSPKKRSGKQQSNIHTRDTQEGLHASASTSSAPPPAQPQPGRPSATQDATMVDDFASEPVAGSSRPRVPPVQTASRAMTPLQPLPRQDELSPATQRLNQEFLEKLAHYQVEIDETHCRPGLPMRFEEYEEAKGLLLDLLGFGMTPEDLIDTQVSKRLVVYCMREMNLRIPFNVDLSDIVPYEPPSIMPLPSDTPPYPESTEPSPNDALVQPGQPPPPSSLPPPIPSHEVPPRPPDVVKPQFPRQRRPTQSHASFSSYGNQSDRIPHAGYPSPMGMNQSAGPPPAFPPDVPYGSFGLNHPINQKTHNITHVNGYPPIPQHMPILPLHMGMPMGIPVNYGVDYQAPSPTTTHQLSNLPRPPFLPNRPEPSSQNRRASSGHLAASSAPTGPPQAAPTTVPPSDPAGARPSAAAPVNPKAAAEAQEMLRKKEAEMREALRARLLKKQGEREAEAAIQRAIASLIPDSATDLTPTDTNESTTPMDHEYVPYVPQAYTSSLDAKLLHPMAAGHTPPPDAGGVFSSAPSLMSILHGTSSTKADTITDPELRPTSKRGIKRPTADDFIDDSSPNKRVHHDNSRPSGSLDVSVTGPLYKRSTTVSFTQFNAARPERVVIHLSEDDEEGGDTSDRDTEMSVIFAVPSRTETPQQETVGDLKKVELQEKLRLMKELLQKKEAERQQRLRSGTATEAQTPRLEETTITPIGTSRSMMSERNGLMVSTSDLQNPLPNSPPSTKESTPVPQVESPQALSPPPPATSSSVTAISVPSPKREVIEIVDDSDEAISDDDVIIIEPPVKVELPPIYTSSLSLPTVSSGSSSQAGDVSQSPPHILSQDLEAQYVPPSMLMAFTQRPLPINFSQSSSIIPNTGSAGPSRSQDFAVDLTALQNSTMQRLDPNRLLCRFESSGAGKCQDRHCEDYHWSDLEPSDDVLAQYLLESVLGLATYDHGEIKGVIQSTRTLNAANMGLSASATASDLQGFTDLVKQALRALPPR